MQRIKWPIRLPDVVPGQDQDPSNETIADGIQHCGVDTSCSWLRHLRFCFCCVLFCALLLLLGLVLLVFLEFENGSREEELVWMVGVARLSLGTMWLTCSKSNWVGVCVIGSGHCLSFLRYDSFASRCNMTQLHPTGIAQEKGKIGLSNEPIFPQIPLSLSTTKTQGRAWSSHKWSMLAPPAGKGSKQEQSKEEPARRWPQKASESRIKSG